MGKFLDSIGFDPHDADPELRDFLLEYDRTDGRMDETVEQKARAAELVSAREKLTNLAKMRRVAKLDQVQLAKLAGTTQWTISKIENGRLEPSVFLALAIANVLEVKIEEIFHIGQPRMLEDANKQFWIPFSKRKTRRPRPSKRKIEPWRSPLDFFDDEDN